MSHHEFFTPASTSYKKFSYSWYFVSIVKHFFALTMIIFLLAWSILRCCLHTQATNFFSRSKSKIFHPSASSSHCLLDFVKMIFLILPPFSYAFRFHAKLLCCWSVTVFHCQFDNCFFYSIVNCYLFFPYEILNRSYFLFSCFLLTWKLNWIWLALVL